jgi:hypothetical protein
MKVNGIDFSEEYAKSVTEEQFVATFKKASWNREGKMEKVIREVHQKVRAEQAKAEAAAKKAEEKAKAEAAKKEAAK